MVRDRAGVGESGKLADVLSDWLNTIESLAKGKILWVKFAKIFSDAGKDENINFVRNLANEWQDSAVHRSHWP